MNCLSPQTAASTAGESSKKPIHNTYSHTVLLLVCSALKAGPVDDDAIWSGAQLFSSTPRSWSSCPVAPWVDPTSSFLVFLVSVFRPSSPLAQSSEDSHALRHVLSSWLDVAWWHGSENVVLAPDSRFLHLTHVLSCWSSPSCARSTSQKLVYV